MAIEVRPAADQAEFRQGLGAIGHFFGWEPSEEDSERFSKLLPVERMLVAIDGKAIVAASGAFPFEMTVPGATVPTAGVTVVGVLPTHRRRGILTAMMRRQLDDTRAGNEPLAALWATEPTIYGRFGYGLASRIGEISLAKDRTRFALPFEPRGTVRLVDLEEAARTFPPLYEQVVAQRPGMFVRSKDWWETRKLFDDPARRQGGPKNLGLLELDGKPAGYAFYHVKQDWVSGFSKGVVNIVEVVTPTPEATRELWRWLLDFDWTSQLTADLLPLDHPLFLLLAEPRRMKFQVNDGVWVRILDVPAALSARTFSGTRTTARRVCGRQPLSSSSSF